MERKERLSISRTHCYLKWRHSRASKSRKIYRHSVPMVKQSRICSRHFSILLSLISILSIRSCRSIGNYKVAARRFLPFPVEMWRIASVKIRFEVFTDKLSCKSEERDNKVIVLFRENSPTRLPLFLFFILFFLLYKENRYR